MNSQSNKNKVKKQLGQYFSGEKVATLLAKLCQSHLALKVIDPMCGTGDMIEACVSNELKNTYYTGIEIDKSIAKKAIKRFTGLKRINIINDNAFSTESLKLLSESEYDLVITNPPYIRYQTSSISDINIPNHLNFSDVRINLLNSIDHFKNIAPEDTTIIKTIISNYSGLSDLAVPSWILCALLTRMGGRLAIVVPQTWLNRDYANIIQYLLLKWFKIEYIIEDGNSAWFIPTQVRTTLLIAKRIETRKSISDWEKEKFTYSKIFSNSISKTSLVGNISGINGNPENNYIKVLKNYSAQNNYFNNKTINIKSFVVELIPKIQNSNWYLKCEASIGIEKIKTNGIKVASELYDWFTENKSNFLNLEDIGVSVGQGLRTGANSFFYLDIVSSKDEGVEVTTHKAIGDMSFNLDNKFYYKVLRKQTELDDTYTLEDYEPKGIVLYLQDYVLKRDLQQIQDLNFDYCQLPKEIERYILAAEKINIGTSENSRYFKTLSAVTPNIRKWNAKKPTLKPRYWYMLPQFTKRHYGDLFIPRVNGQTPITRLNALSPIIIDANFSTLWISDTNSKYNNYALLALLNSSWCVINMEEFGTVMGGGALKLDATQIKKIPIPYLEDHQINILSKLGEQLAKAEGHSSSLINEIDTTISSKFFSGKELSVKLQQLLNIKSALLNIRIKK